MKYCYGIQIVFMIGFVGKSHVKRIASLVKGRGTMSEANGGGILSSYYVLSQETTA